MTKYTGLIQVMVLLSLSLLATGCTFGLRKEVQVIYGNIAAPVGQGAVRIATNNQIPVTVGDDASSMDLGGYYVLNSSDMKLFIRLLKEK